MTSECRPGMLGRRFGLPDRSLALALTTLVCLLAAPGVQGNGWEHAAIPFEALVTALNFEHPETRRRAAESLGLRDDSRALMPLRRRLEIPEQNPYVRDAIYVALGRLADITDAPRLTGCLEKESRDEIRGHCATALGRLGAPQSRNVLLTLANRESESKTVSAAAILALAAYPDPEMIVELGRLARTQGPLAPAAVVALGTTGVSAATPPLLALLEETEVPELRAAAVVALAMIGDSSAAPVLLEIVETEQDPRIRVRAVAALASVKSGSPSQALIGLLRDPLPAVQLHAIKGLHRSGAAEDGRALAEYAEGLVQGLAQVAKAGWQRHPPQSLEDLALLEPALRALADLDADAGTRAMLETALLPRPPLGNPHSLRLADATYRCRRAALYGLGYSGSDEVVATLLGDAGLRDPDPRLRAVAIRSLGIHGVSRTAPYLEAALGDPAPEVRWTAARVLGLMRAHGVTGTLAKGLGDPNRQVRMEAATALGLLDDQGAVIKLTRLAATDPEQIVRTAAQLALKRLKEPSTAAHGHDP